ncbi:MAG: 50S ribosomal protein L9 [Treponema sp.]|nr:50S ribosomal protein L9 [Treponema sp.]
MKVILNEDIKYLGEEGDVKNVANGYYRNYLGPRHLAVPYNELTAKIFEGRKAEIEAKKEQKRKDSQSLKEKLEALALEIVMPAAANGKLFGAVSSQVIQELLLKNGFEIERKRIEIPGVAIKSVGNYHFTVKLYESQIAELNISVKAQEEEKVESNKKERKPKEKNSTKDSEKVSEETQEVKENA